VHERSLALAEFKDFFDLSHAVLTPKSQALLVAAISAGSLTALKALLTDHKTSKEQLSFLARDFLIWSETEPVVFDWLKEALSEAPRTQSLRVVSESPAAPDQDSIDRDCGIHAFEAMQSITELIFDFDQHLVREVSKGSMGLPDVKRLSAHLGKSKEYVKAILELAKISGLIAISEKRFQPTEMADDWISNNPTKRWQILAEAWITLLGPAGQKELTTNQTKDRPSYLPDLVLASFPLLNYSVNSRIARLVELSDAIGITAAGFSSSWLKSVLAGKQALAAKAVEQRLPAQQERIIIQADLSIIAPGPLASSLEIQLRKFADTENIGLASGYRISPISINVGLEEGLTEEQIRGLLEKLSDAPLPQPVDYLLSETSERFGRLKISATEKGSFLISSDELLGKQILMDSKLKSLMLSQTDLGITCPLELDTFYHTLRQNGYLAVRVDANGKLIAPSSIHKSSSEATVFGDQLERLRKQDLELSDDAPANDMERKIQLALRSKSSLQVEVNANGKIMNFLLEPIGMANGRLRARDRKADIERTLPISAITSITIG
jgi:hypothetical protein